jgi:shikimate kinase
VKIILVGYMGSGKSTIGKKLAENLNLPFIDLDAHIENGEQKTISELFATEGQISFRKKEHEHLNFLLKDSEAMVLATGGGAPCYSGNMKIILEATPNVFYLRVTIPQLISRLAPEKTSRPLIAHLDEDEMGEFFGKHLFERNTYYSMAHHTIACDGKSIEEISSEIERLLV